MRLHPLPNLSAVNSASIEDWTAERLQQTVHSGEGEQIIVVSCREPYSHEYTDSGVTVCSPASGLITALEPVVRACGGTWIAYASGTADAAFVDANAVCRVPPHRPEYSLQRVWLEDDARRGFLDGFANESLWPLCHNSDVEPTFNVSDFSHYRRVNERFAQEVVRAASQPDPLVLVQDYHFALLPQLIRNRLPRATIVSFWHIPWPARARLQRCPWWNAVVGGLMGSSIVGFQTNRDKTNFEEAAQLLESRGNGRHGAGVSTATPVVASYPISVAWPTACEIDALPSVADCRLRILRENALPHHVRLIAGVDRFDYTKGLLDKVRAMELLLDSQPQWQGSVSLVQVVAPTRSGVPAYAAYQNRVRAEVERINGRFGRDGVAPIILLECLHDRPAVFRLYRAACVCTVTSLQDGMNLVSKEFVSARDDEQGVLVLSQFAGAAEELHQGAIVVDPRDTRALADALADALNMRKPQQRSRMLRMRSVVRDANIYQWAGTMLRDAASLRQAVGTRAYDGWPAVA